MEELRQVIDALWLTDEIHWDIALYTIFFINIVLMLMQPDGAPLAVGLCILVLVSAVIDKTLAFGYMFDVGRYTREQCHEQVFIGTYLIRVVMFAAPLSVAGMTKSPNARGVGIVAGLIGGVYLFARWFIEQRDVPLDDLVCMLFVTGFAWQQAGLALLGARAVLRDRFLLGRIDRHQPVLILGDAAADDVGVELA